MAGELGAGDTRDTDDALADAERWGLDDGELEAVRSTLGQQRGFRLWGMHLKAFDALIVAGTQFRSTLVATERGFTSRVTGLDYASVKTILDGLELKLTRDDWQRLRVLEAAAKDAINGAPAPAWLEVV